MPTMLDATGESPNTEQPGKLGASGEPFAVVRDATAFDRAGCVMWALRAIFALVGLRWKRPSRSA